MHLALVCRQIGHYHDARFRAARERFDAFSVVSAANEGGFAEFLARDTGGYPVSRLFPDREKFRSAVAHGEMPGAVGRALDRIGPDVVAVSGWAAPEALSAIGWARRNRAGVVLMSESQSFDAGRRSTVKEYLKGRIVRQCDAALVGGPSHRDYVVELGLPPSKVRLGYNAIGNEHFSRGADAARAEGQALRARLGLPDRYILASARFIAKKNLPALVEAYGRALALVGEGPDLVILGDGAERAAVEAAIAAQGLQARVHLPGFRGYDVLPAFYGLAEAFVHVSRVEQWGLVVNEAMAAGLPVIVSRPCGAAVLVRERANGWLVDAFDVGAMAETLAGLFRLDPGEREKMGQASRQIVADWGPERFGEALRAAAEIAGSRPPRRPLAPWDAALLNRLSRMVIEDVA